MVVRCLCLLSITFCLTSLYGQSHYLLSKFEATRHENRIILSWTIKQGGSCFGIGIFRSTDNTEFEKIGEITGNCGSSENEQNFIYIDDNPVKNMINYYVLEMGFSGKTKPPLEAEFFDFDKNSSKVIPNPFKDSARILFINPDFATYTLYIFEESGKLLKTAISKEDAFILTSDDIHYNTPATERKFYYIITDEKGQRITSGIFITRSE